MTTVEARATSKLSTPIVIKTDPKYENLIPKISQKEFDELKQSIDEKGLLEKIIVNQDGFCLDGHTRLRVLKELKRPVPQDKIEVRHFDDPLDELEYIWIINSIRRHYTEYQKYQAGKEIMKLEAEKAKRRQSEAGKTYGRGKVVEQKEQQENSLLSNGSKLSNDDGDEKQQQNDDKNERTAIAIAAKKVGLSPTTFYRYNYVDKYGTPEQIQRLSENKSEVNTEFNAVKSAEKRQKRRENAARLNIDIPNMDLRLGDMRIEGQKIPENSIPMILTDPPYPKQYLYLYKDLGALANRVLVPGGALVVMVGQYYMHECMDLLEAGGPSLRWGWPLTLVLGGNYQSAHPKKIFIMCKHLLYYIKGDKPRDEVVDYMADLIDSRPPEKLLHPKGWEQSDVEARHVISKLTVENEVVLDPFLGTSSFGIGALKLNRKFIGIEIDPNILADARHNITYHLDKNQEKESSQ